MALHAKLLAQWIANTVTLEPLLVYGTSVREGAPAKPDEDQAIIGAIPARCVFVRPSTGIRDRPWNGGGGERFPGLDIIVRGINNDFDDAYALADAVWDAVDKNPPPGYFESRAEGSGPSHFRVDEWGHHEFLIHVTLHKQV